MLAHPRKLPSGLAVFLTMPPVDAYAGEIEVGTSATIATRGERLLEARYRLMNRESSPFGLALQISPRWSPTDETSGEPVTSYSAAFAVLADKEIDFEPHMATLTRWL